jgi:predicted unusual protein kinase regulating ubiquinone biosynthesis (AarF/ABC1/UbiB family)
MVSFRSKKEKVFSPERLMSDFPSSKFERSKLFAKAGLKAGKNYAGHYLRHPLNPGENIADLHQKNAEDIFKEFTNLRGTALKIAQSLSMDQGFLPDEFAEVMTRAQYKVPPINKALVRSVIKSELGKYPEQLFKSFQPEAIAAASIGQVHKATLHDGRNVAVKIQYPGVRNTIESDLAIARTIFKRIVKRGSDIDYYFEEVRDTLLKETDYRIEGEQLETFIQLFSGKEILIPEWIPELSSEKVLTMTFIDGLHLGEFLSTDPSRKERDNYGQLLWDFFHLQVEKRDLIHADTHPGNFLLTPDNKLGVIDFGCVKKFPDDFFINYLKLLPTHLNRNEEEIIHLYKELKVLKEHPSKSSTERIYYEFCRDYGYTFAKPYSAESFDFGDTSYHDLIRSFTKNAPISNEPRGSRHFIYSTRVHLGLYYLLMKLGARIKTGKSRVIIEEMLAETNP